MASDGKGCRDLRRLIRSRCKGALKQVNEWKGELSVLPSGIWKRQEPLERIYGRFPSVDPSGRFARVPNLDKPLYSEKTIYSTANKTAINRPIDHTGET